MSAVVTNTSFLNPIGFKVVFSRIPTVEYFCQSVIIPEVSLSSINVPNPIQDLNLSSTSLKYGQFIMDFKVDEDMKNYNEVLKWMVDLSSSKESTQYMKLYDKTPGDGKGPRSEASVIVLSSSKNPNIDIKLIDVVPTGISNLKFSTTETDINYLECTATFSLREFIVNKI